MEVEAKPLRKKPWETPVLSVIRFQETAVGGNQTNDGGTPGGPLNSPSRFS